MIYPVDSAIQRSNNCALTGKLCYKAININVLVVVYVQNCKAPRELNLLSVTPLYNLILAVH